MIKQIASNKTNSLVTFLNPFSYILARKNPSLFKEFSLKIDGILVVQLLKLFRVISVKRESFDSTSLAPIVFNDAIASNKSVYLIGSKQEEIEKSVEQIKKAYPKLSIIEFRNGYLTKDERNAVLTHIQSLNPDIVVCGMGTILQEKFLLDLKKTGWSGRGYTCGGFLHQSANNINYYPKWVDRYNLRIFYRMMKEPHALKRILWSYPLFMVLFTYDVMNYHLKKD